MIDFDELGAWDRFVAAGLAGLLSSGKVSHESLEHVVGDAVRAADLAIDKRRDKIAELGKPAVIPLARGGFPGIDGDGS